MPHLLGLNLLATHATPHFPPRISPQYDGCAKLTRDGFDDFCPKSFSLQAPSGFLHRHPGMPQLQHHPLHCDVENILSWLVHTPSIETRERDSYGDSAINIDANFGANGRADAVAGMDDDAPKTPQKRRRGDDFDIDQTPRGLRLPAQGSLDAPDNSDSLSLCSGSVKSASNTSSASNRSGRNSPRKREIALRFATQYPVQREAINSEAPPPLPQPLLDLLRDLIDIGGGKKAIIPSIFKGSLPTSWTYNPNHDDGLFFHVENDHDNTSNQDFALHHRHAILQAVCKQSKICQRRVEYEAGWNEQVHSRLLSDALEGLGSVHFRNM